METRRLPRLMALLRQRPHGKALLNGDCRVTLRFYQCRHGVLTAVEAENLQTEGSASLFIEGLKTRLPSLPLCQGYGCLIFLCDDFSLHHVTRKKVILRDEGGRILAEGCIRSWDSL